MNCLGKVVTGFRKKACKIRFSGIRTGLRANSDYRRSVVLPVNSITDHVYMGRRRTDPEKFTKALGLRIREMRNARGWTLEACEEHGYSNWRHLQAVESGKKNITIHTIVNIANLFGITPAELLKDL